MAERYAFGLWQEGMMVVSVDAPTLHDALCEIGHYGIVYQQDGPIEIRRIDPDTLEPMPPKEAVR